MYKDFSGNLLQLHLRKEKAVENRIVEVISEAVTSFTFCHPKFFASLVNVLRWPMK